MLRARPCPTDDYLDAIALARLILPPEIHLQAPPNLSDDFGVLLDAGIDDWGGVSPVTADHVNPERPWPDLDRLREVTEARAASCWRRASPIYPEFALDPDRWLDDGLRFPVLDRSDAEGLGPRRPRRGAGAAHHDRRAPSRSTTASRCSTSAPGARRGTPVRRSSPPVAGAPGSPRSSGRGGRGAGRVRCWARSSGVDEIVTLFSARGPEVAAVAEVADDLRRATVGDVVTFVAQPQHQLHERVHVQVQVLRLLQGPAVAEPAGHALPAHAGRHPGPGAGGGRPGRHRGVPAGRHPPRASTATTTSTSPGR